MTGSRIQLYEKEYAWDRAYLPKEITSRGKAIARRMRVVAMIAGREVTLEPDSIRLEGVRNDAATVIAEGIVAEDLSLKVTTTVEFDGVAMVTVELIPAKPTYVDGLEFWVDLTDSPYTRILTYKVDSVRPQKFRDDLLKVPYRGEFINVLGFSNGDSSFWWFADNAEGWIWNADSVTEVTRNASELKLRQRLVGGRWLVTERMQFKFNFMATPVRDLSADREQRIVSAHPDREQARLGGKFKIWWTSAFAHDAFPYVEYPDEVIDSVPQADRRAYPGLAENRRLVQETRSGLGIEWIPYFSAHCLSVLDPVLRQNRDQWQVEPRASYRDGLNPYATRYEKPWLTHRAPGYSDYLLSRLGEAFQALDARGVYFDHGNVLDSINPRNGAWTDSNGVTRGSLDILALRSFFKRLRALFQQQRKPGYVFVHNSNREIIPAYTFITATVDGEQFEHRPDSGRSPILTNGDYLAVIGLDEFRARFSPHQYGVNTVWLGEEWTSHVGDPNWQRSEGNRTAYRRQKGLALLHDVTDWDPYFHEAERREIAALLDRFGVRGAEFIGYWNPKNAVTINDAAVKVSYYRKPGSTALLLVALNVSEHDVDTVIGIRGQEGGGASYSYFVAQAGNWGRRAQGPAEIRIKSRDFALIWVQ